ncbi:MAG: hypothetical protein IJU51_07855 [Clostridia bacterium]|nr:hypothetical protein [Clostridia bacterium]
MKKTVCTLIAALLLLTASACAGKESKNTSANSISTASQTEMISDAESSAFSSADENPLSSKTSHPDIEEATFNSTKDYSDTVTARFLDVNKFSDKTKSNVIDVLNGDTLTLDSEGKFSIAKGLTMNFTAAVSKDGTNTSFSMDIAGQSIRVIRNESGTYVLDENTKTAKLSKSQDTNEKESAFYSNPASGKVVSFISGIFGSDPLTYVKTSAEVYEGESLTCEEYAVGKTAIKIYYDGSTIRYATVDKDGAVSSVKINKLTSVPDPESFKLPDGYTVEE